ncbi:MAG: hypothetical protein V2A73_15485 [Pseudomonadota bacterium]
MVEWPATAQLANPTLPSPVEPATANTGINDDPNLDRTWFSPTALTQPEGSFSFNDYELILLGATYGVTDSFQISGMIVPPIVENMPFFGLASAKLAANRAGKVRLALVGTLFYGSDGDDDSVWFSTVGGVASYCLDESCSSLLSGFALAGFAKEMDDDILPVLYGGSLTARMSRNVKLIVEAASAATFGEEDSWTRSALVSYGVRFFSSNIAGDVGFVKPVGEDVGDGFLLGIPMLTFTYRAR